MGVICGRTLLGPVLILMLTAGVVPQSSTRSAPGEPRPAGAQSPSSTQSSESKASNSKFEEQKPTIVYESATVLKTITRLVVVDVVATDKNGPVTNLERGDFTILEDGKEQQIRVFNFQQPHQMPANALQAERKLPENVYTN